MFLASPNIGEEKATDAYHPPNIGEEKAEFVMFFSKYRGGKGRETIASLQI